MPRGKKGDYPIRFKGGGLDGHKCPAHLIDTSYHYHAYREHIVQSDDAPKYDCYEWSSVLGMMAYRGTVFGHEGCGRAVKTQDLPKIAPDNKWFWR